MKFNLPFGTHRPSNAIRIVLLVLLALLLTDCYAYFFRKKVLRSESMGFFTIKPSTVDDFDAVNEDSRLEHPIQLDQARIKDYFGNLRYSKRSSVGYFSDYVFSDHELDLLARDLPYALKNLPEDRLLLIISKYDDTQSVISFDEITSCILWASKGRINLLFGRIKRELVDKEASLDFDRWTRVETIRLSHTTDGTEISDGENVDFGVVEGLPLRKWVSFDMKNPGKYKFLPRKQYQPVKLTDENDRP
ncbi:LA_1326/LA_4305 family lipoprotein [Leptospira wolffii]|uniref:LA_1326/LA_4305 family lipoprotein n=1 Tax=Leptospira wolffii TaxID=409998 RepID=A0ABV5BKT2_9LEPT|nr:hypothetical protein [Leptospira wolffii]TGL49464.1 hypothetical protein EHQ61_13545 [Leptospira wolffii]